MEKGDKGSTLTGMGVSGWMFLLVLAYPDCPRSKAVKRSLVVVSNWLYCFSFWGRCPETFTGAPPLTPLCPPISAYEPIIVWLSAMYSYSYIHVLQSSKADDCAFGPDRQGSIGDESVPIITINDVVNSSFKTSVTFLVITNHISFWVLFDKIVSVYFIWKVFSILALEMASPGNRHCANCIGTLSFPIVWCRQSLFTTR